MDTGRLSLKKRLALEIHRANRKLTAKAHPLRTLFWESTLRCNLKCLHCGSDCKSIAATPDMPADDFLKVVDSIIPFVDPHNLLVIISGGEPLMRADLEKVGIELYKREFPWGIVTNGLALSDHRLQSLRQAGLKTISVSIDGLEDEHNWLRGHRESYTMALGALRKISKCPELVWDAITCVNQRNLSSLPELKRRLIDAGVKDWRLFTIFPFGRAAGIDELQLDPQQYHELMRFIIETREEGLINASYCCEGFLGGYEGEVRDSFYGCAAGITVGSILIDGSISACTSIRGKYHQGNIYRDNFMDVWENGFKEYRDRSWMKKDECAECKMWRYCEGNGMHLRDLSGHLTRCNYNELNKLI